VPEIEKQITIVNKLGLHARAAAKLVTVASGFESDIQLIRDSRRANAKSIMGVMMLAAGKGTALKMIVNGNDANSAASAIEELVNDKFGEGE